MCTTLAVQNYAGQTISEKVWLDEIKHWWGREYLQLKTTTGYTLHNKKLTKDARSTNVTM